MTDDDQLNFFKDKCIDLAKKFGTDPSMLARNDAPTTSIDAAEKCNSTKLEEMVYGVIKGFGEDGCISDDVRAHYPNLAYSSVTARYKALENKNYIYYRGDKRPGLSGRQQRVMRAR